MSHRKFTIAIAVLVALATASCSNESATSDIAAPTTTAPTTAAPTTAAPTATADSTAAPTAPVPAPTPVVDIFAEGRIVNLYWVRGEAIAAGSMRAKSTSIAAEAIGQLLRGPTFFDQEAEMASAIPAGVELLGLTISDGRAIVDLSSDFESVSFGTAGELAMVAQVVYTLTQFDTVERVDIWIDGQERDAILSHGLEARGLTRQGLADAVAPAIVVERPFPGERIWAPITVRGFSRTFESTVVWELSDSQGAVVQSGFTTANQPDVGVHGPFQFTIDVPGPPWVGTELTVFEESAKDGSRINEYTVDFSLRGGPTSSLAEARPLLRGDGFGPSDFGTPRAQVEAALLSLLGTSGELSEITSFCGPPASQLTLGPLSLWFDDDDGLVGWMYHGRRDDASPNLMTADAIAPGTSRASLQARYPDLSTSTDTLSPEFWVPTAQLSGFFTDDGQTITALYAGSPCFYR